MHGRKDAPPEKTPDKTPEGADPFGDGHAVDARFSEGAALDRVRNKCLIASWCVGAMAGLVKGFYGGGDGNLFVPAAVGLALVLVSAMAGGALGVLTHYVYGWLKKRPAAEVDHVGGMVLGSFMGSFLGLIITVMFGEPWFTDYGAAIGSGLGSFTGALPGGTGAVMLRMLAHDSRSEKKPKH